jgi:hypothetical protein
LTREAIEQLAAEESGEGRGSLITYPDQYFVGDWRRWETRRRPSGGPFHWLQERKLWRRSTPPALHRFRPVDRLAPFPDMPALTTLLPARRRLPFFISHRPRHLYVVPSLADAEGLRQTYGLPSDRVAVVRPGARRYLHAFPTPAFLPEGFALFLVGRRRDRRRQRRLLRILSERLPDLPSRIIPLEERHDFSPGAWLRLLARTRALFYLVPDPFDWPVLALESCFYGLPTVFSDENAALSELLPGSPLRLSRFLVEGTSLSSLARSAREAKDILTARGVFEPQGQARQYLPLYRSLGAS